MQLLQLDPFLFGEFTVVFMLKRVGPVYYLSNLVYNSLLSDVVFDVQFILYLKQMVEKA